MQLSSLCMTGSIFRLLGSRGLTSYSFQASNLGVVLICRHKQGLIERVIGVANPMPRILKNQGTSKFNNSSHASKIRETREWFGPYLMAGIGLALVTSRRNTADAIPNEAIPWLSQVLVFQLDSIRFSIQFHDNFVQIDRDRRSRGAKRKQMWDDAMRTSSAPWSQLRPSAIAAFLSPSNLHLVMTRRRECTHVHWPQMIMVLKGVF